MQLQIMTFVIKTVITINIRMLLLSENFRSYLKDSRETSTNKMIRPYKMERNAILTC